MAHLEWALSSSRTNEAENAVVAFRRSDSGSLERLGFLPDGVAPATASLRPHSSAFDQIVPPGS